MLLVAVAVAVAVSVVKFIEISSRLTLPTPWEYDVTHPPSVFIAPSLPNINIIFPLSLSLPNQPHSLRATINNIVPPIPFRPSPPLYSPISFPPRVPTPYVIALEIVAEISPLSMTSVLSFHSAVATARCRSPRRVHWGEYLRVLSGIREKKIGRVYVSVDQDLTA
jgi:hypothetical protein